MPFYTVLLIWMISESHAVYPNGTYKGEVTNPYLSINCIFYEPPYPETPYVDMHVTCDDTKGPASSTVGIEAARGSYETKFYVSGIDIDSIQQMTADLDMTCPGRDYSIGDFTVFIEVDKGVSYNVYVNQEPVKIQKIPY
ncbi:hypothetical protein FOL47_001468 [Perkinsus chesapeaki]|uniref:Uncharacterized protein n=1 Tax=Perkinsus chesapeaki TaxID=330153 RepID=A0A7J6MJ81_PERCH|nr:hypothetical protein FOL47_001468 [Perkinsus chesapeaki]